MKQEGYQLTMEDSVGLLEILSSLSVMSEFARQVGSTQTAEDFELKRRWLEQFMARIGAGDMLARKKMELEGFRIPEKGESLQ